METMPNLKPPTKEDEADATTSGQNNSAHERDLKLAGRMIQSVIDECTGVEDQKDFPPPADSIMDERTRQYIEWTFQADSVKGIFQNLEYIITEGLRAQRESENETEMETTDFASSAGAALRAQEQGLGEGKSASQRSGNRQLKEDEVEDVAVDATHALTWAQKTKKMLLERSPTSLFVSFEAYHRGKNKETLEECLNMEMGVVEAFVVSFSFPSIVSRYRVSLSLSPSPFVTLASLRKPSLPSPSIP